MIQSNRNKKTTELTYSLYSMINKIEKNIDIIDNNSYKNLLFKFDNLFEKKMDAIYQFSDTSHLAIYIVFSNGTFDLISSEQQLYEDEYYQDYILIYSLWPKHNYNDFDPFKNADLQMKKQLYNIFFTETGKKTIKEVCTECIATIINLYSLSNLFALAYKKIPYSIASNEQKLYCLFSNYIENELTATISIHYLKKYNEDLEIEEFKNDILYQVSLDDMYFDAVFEVNKLFSKIEKKNWIPYMYSFCKMFLEYIYKYW